MYLDTRDLYVEMEELCERQAAIAEGGEEAEAHEPLTDEEEARLTALVDLFDLIGEKPGWYGETMIPDWEFRRYAEELADDIGALMSSETGWPHNHIDWEAAADELAMDYSVVEFDGETYYIRL